MLAVCIAGGPSLQWEDVQTCRDHAFTIAINESWLMAPWADVLYAADYAWWMRHPDAWSFPGHRLGCQNKNSEKFGVTVLKNLGYLGWSEDPDAVYNGSHSGYQAIQVAATRYGATTIALLGYDVKAGNGQKNWYPNPKTKPFERWLSTYGTLADAARARNITIWNCSRDTAITAFPRRSLAEVLCDVSPSCR
jgi:hypothetical protein